MNQIWVEFNVHYDEGYSIQTNGLDDEDDSHDHGTRQPETSGSHSHVRDLGQYQGTGTSNSDL